MILVSHANFHKLKFPFKYSQKEIDNNNKPYDPVFSSTPNHCLIKDKYEFGGVEGS